MDKALKNSPPKNVAYIGRIERVPNRRAIYIYKVWNDANQFFSDIFTAVVVVVA